jgi:hypothetical protein
MAYALAIISGKRYADSNAHPEVVVKHTQVNIQMNSDPAL